MLIEAQKLTWQEIGEQEEEKRNKFNKTLTHLHFVDVFFLLYICRILKQTIKICQNYSIELHTKIHNKGCGMIQKEILQD